MGPGGGGVGTAVCFLRGALLVGTEGNQIVKIPLGGAQAENDGGEEGVGGEEEDGEAVTAALEKSRMVGCEVVVSGNPSTLTPAAVD